MSLDISNGFVINSKTVSFIIALFTLSGLFIGLITWVNGYMFKVEVLEGRVTTQDGVVAKLTEQVENANTRIVDLTIALNRLQDRQTKLTGG